MELTDRRRFLLAAVGAGGSLGIGAAVWSRLWGGVEEVSRSGWAFGTRVSITVLSDSGKTADRALDAAFSELELVEDLMSLYRPESQLRCLNRRGVLDNAHPYLVSVLRTAAALSRRTAGAFDVTVQPLWTLWSGADRSGGLPDPQEVEKVAKNVDWRNVQLDSGRIRLLSPATKVTLNGIAQGFAADRAAAALRRHGIERALIDTGEIGSFGTRSDGGAWTVGIQHPRRDDAFAGLVELRGRSLATSGDYSVSFDEDYRDNHLFDPRTGRSPQALASVSVAAPTATEADALSTALFVLSLEEGLQLLRSSPGADAMFIFKDGRTLATENFPSA